MPNPVLQVENLVKRYGEVEAVRGVSFSVEQGEVFGLLGPNGAGKPARSRCWRVCAFPTADEFRCAASTRKRIRMS